MYLGEYNRLINIINKDNVDSKKVNEAVELLTEINLTDIKKNNYDLIEDFIVFVVNNTDISENLKKLLDKPLNYIRSKNI